MKKILLPILIYFLFVGCKKDSVNVKPIGLNIDGKTYITDIFDGQEWTKENYDGSQGIYYNNIKSEDGKLLNLYEVQNVTKSLPNNWRLPTTKDYIRLAKASGGDFKNKDASNYSDYDIIDEEFNDKAVQNFLFGSLFGLKFAGEKSGSSFTEKGTFTFFWTSIIIPPSTTGSYYLPVALGFTKTGNSISASFAEYPQPMTKATDNSRNSGSLRLVRDLK